jgi:membrane protein YqaA with SNARE-associated domain
MISIRHGRVAEVETAAFTVYGALWASAFLAATLLPGSSEALLTGLAVTGYGDPVLLLAVATSGNVMGSLANWFCGRFLSRFRNRPRFPVLPRRYEQAVAWYARYGRWSLLFAWVPIIGDPLTVVAGALSVPLGPFLVLVTIGKLTRYGVVLAIASAWVRA